MEVAREDEVERAGRQPVDDAREVAEQDAEGGIAVASSAGRALPRVGARVDADDLDAPAAQLDRRSLVDEQVRGREVDPRRPAT